MVVSIKTDASQKNLYLPAYNDNGKCRFLFGSPSKLLSNSSIIQTISVTLSLVIIAIFVL